jgi:hypothetical protein
MRLFFLLIFFSSLTFAQDHYYLAGKLYNCWLYFRVNGNDVNWMEDGVRDEVWFSKIEITPYVKDFSNFALKIIALPVGEQDFAFDVCILKNNEKLFEEKQEIAKENIYKKNIFEFLIDK